MNAPCVAIPFEAWPPEKLAAIVTACQAHRNWYSDLDYNKGEAHRRELVIGRLSDACSRTWEVYRDGTLVGILHADKIVPGADCVAHFLFFDRDLHSKRALCLNVMKYLFDAYQLHAIRVEIPTYAAKLVGYVRKALYFRFETEQRPFSWPSSALPLNADAAKLGSRKHQAILHEGKWCDILLLSITRHEFEQIMEDQNNRTFDSATPALRT